MDHNLGAPRETVADRMDNILRLGMSIKEQATTGGPARSSKRDWASALQVIRQAAEAMSATEERAKDIETRSRAMADRAVEELKNAERRIHAAETALRTAESAARSAEARAREAETRAQEAEEWLMRFHDEILKYLIARRGDSQDAGALPLEALTKEPLFPSRRSVTAA
jgi:hypothetical protein